MKTLIKSMKNPPFIVENISFTLTKLSILSHFGHDLYNIYVSI